MPKKTPRLKVVGPTTSTKTKVEQLIESGSRLAALHHIEDFGSIAELCESPIEELLLAALYNASKLTDPAMQFMTHTSEITSPWSDETAYVYQQTVIGKYRVDIAINDCSLPFELGQPRVMIVECDGHDFHERTKEQARRDKQRDRFLVSRGFKLLRFTGSEIWADPEACAEEIINELACNDAWRQRQK